MEQTGFRADCSIWCQPAPNGIQVARVLAVSGRRVTRDSGLRGCPLLSCSSAGSSLLATKGVITVLGFGNLKCFVGRETGDWVGFRFSRGLWWWSQGGSDGVGAVSVKWKGEEGRWSLISGLKLHPCPSEQRPKSLSWLSLSPGHLMMVQLGTICLTYLCVSFSTTNVASRIVNLWLLWGLYKLIYLKFIACSQCQ